MMIKRSHLFVILFACLLVTGSCTTTKGPKSILFNQINGKSESQNTYTSSFPSRNVSSKLKEIQHSILHVITKATYRMYRFKHKYVTAKTIQQAGGADSLAAVKSKHQNGRAGTAICILNNGNYAAFLTAHHVVTYPDTLISYRKGKNIPEHKYIATIGFKINQNNFLVKSDNIFRVNILASDPKSDLGLLISSGKNINAIPAISIRLGNSKRLRVGSFVYILGYPLGALMVTRAIVSNPNYDGHGSFLTDAVTNHGVSGGMIVASDDDYHSFEWVGMAETALGKQRHYLIPDPSGNSTYWQHEAYTDTTYIAKRWSIYYGVMSSTSINQIRFFLFRHADDLHKYGLKIKDIL